MAKQILFEDERGYLLMDGNELTIGSKIDDPPKIRLTSPGTEHGGAGGVVSFNLSRNTGTICDGHQQTEMAMIRVEQASDVRGQASNPKAEINFLLNDGGTADSNMQKPFAFIWNAITTLKLALGFGAAQQDFLQAGPYRFYLQGDRNLVLYDTSTTPWTAVWSSGTNI